MRSSGRNAGLSVSAANVRCNWAVRVPSRSASDKNGPKVRETVTGINRSAARTIPSAGSRKISAALGDGPQLIDASAARPAGNVFLHGDALLRPAQDCTDGYGSGLAFCRIDEVGPGSFRQTIVRRLRPPARVHTFNFTPRYVAIDRAGTRARNPSLAGLARR